MKWYMIFFAFVHVDVQRDCIHTSYFPLLESSERHRFAAPQQFPFSLNLVHSPY